MKDKISVIIVGKSDTPANGRLFLALMTTLIDFQTGVNLNETPIEYIAVDDYLQPNDRVKVIKQPKPFNYNACLNAGAKVATGNYLYFANNDLLFTPGALDELVKQMKRHRLGSASAICPKAHAATKTRAGVMISYNVGTHFTGWGFMLTRATYEAIDGLKTNCPFYCADNETVEQLKAAHINHGLVKSAVIKHVGQQTQKGLDSATFFEYTRESVIKFNKLYGANIFNLNPENKN